jgi:hypothetical protein
VAVADTLPPELGYTLDEILDEDWRPDWRKPHQA